MNVHKCRVCLKLNPLEPMKSLCMSVDDHGISTVYDIMLFCIPQLLYSLQKSDFICTNCMHNLIECEKFIKLCLQSDDHIKKEILDNTNSEAIEEDNKDFVILDTCNNGANESDDHLNTEIIFSYSEEENDDCKPLQVKTETEITTQEDTQSDIETNEFKEEEINSTPVKDDTSHTTTTEEENDAQEDKSQLKLLLEGKHPICNQKPLLGNELKKGLKTTIANTSSHSKVTNRNVKSYICKLGCGKKIIKRTEQSQHVCRFNCRKCKMKFDSKMDLGKHVKENLDMKECKTVCSHCSISILSKDFEEHLKSHPTIMCEICSKCFATVSSLRSHKVVHNEKTEKCPECDLSFKCKGSLRTHLDSIHKRREREVLCDLCPKKFFVNAKLMIHKRMHHFKIRNASCPKCGKKFHSQKAAEFHDRLVHLQLKPFSCEHCDKPFGRKDYKLNHEKTCFKSLVKKDSPTTRRRKTLSTYKPNTASNKPLECMYCHKVQKSVVHLTGHIKRVHTKRPRKHKCDVCGLQFAAKLSLSNHERIHNDPDSKYRCDVCYKKYKSLDELQDHVSQKHKKKPYKCDVCGEKFCRKFILENHRYAVHPNASNNTTGEEKTQEILEKALRHLDRLDDA